MSAPNLEGLREIVNAKIAAQECAEQMGKLMRTDAQKMQAQLVDLYKHKMSRESMIAFYSRCIKRCESKLQKLGTSPDEKEKCVFSITKHESSIEYHSKWLQDIEEEVQHLDVSKEFAEEAMAKVLDEKRQYLEQDDLEADLQYYYMEYRYYRDEADSGRKRPHDREQRDSFLQKIGETEERMAKKRASDTNVASGK